MGAITRFSAVEPGPCNPRRAVVLGCRAYQHANHGTWCLPTGYRGYINHRGVPISCADFVAINVGALSNHQTKGAYNVMTDLVAVFASDASNRVEYMLLAEDDLQHSAEVSASLANAREVAKRMR